jgi:hypothetical protein
MENLMDIFSAIEESGRGILYPLFFFAWLRMC